jgi:putative hydrolase of HD superfamily
MSAPDDLHLRLLELQKLLFQFTQVERQIYFPDDKKTDRLENDAEHSYSLAMAVWFLSPHFSHLDRDKMIRYALVHDFVEVHAGDMQAIGRTKEQQDLKQQREAEALLQLRDEWPDFSELTKTIEEYEEQVDGESKFVFALDKIMPMLLNLLSKGKTWKKYGFTRTDVIRQKDEKVKVSPEVQELWEMYRHIVIEAKDHFLEGKS